MWRPIAWSGVYPNSCSAAGFQAVTRSSVSIVTTAAGLIATSDSKYDFCRASSAVRSSTRRSRVSTFSRSWAVMSLNAMVSVPTSSREVTGAVALRSPAVTAVAVFASRMIGRVTWRAISHMPTASNSAESRPTTPIVSASCWAGAKAVDWGSSTSRAASCSVSQRYTPMTGTPV